MATRKSKSEEIYAVATATTSNGFGHITIYVHNAVGHGGATIKLHCQSGGTSPGETYGWKHGLWKDYDVMDVETLRKGYWLLRAMKRKLDKVYTDQGNAKNFPEYALRVLRAAGVRSVYLRPGLNSTFYGDATTLHGYNPVRHGDSLLNELVNMEQAILGASCY
jgi:hypothetical protein